MTTTTRNWPWWGAVAGLMVGGVDYTLFWVFDVQMTWNDTDITAPVMGLFGLNFAGFGFVLGRLTLAKRTIVDQLASVERSRSRAQQAEKLASIGQLAAGVAHEVRNPLAVIRSSASLITDLVTDDADVERAGQFIRAEVDRLDTFITELLDFSKPVDLIKEQIELRSTIEHVFVLATSVAIAREIRLVIIGDAWALADVTPLSSVFLTLVINGCQSADPGGWVEFETSQHPDFTRIDIRDSGPGVAPDLVERIFEPFFTTKSRGTGLGLSMAARIAEAHGGSLHLLPSSTGAHFRIELPNKEPV